MPITRIVLALLLALVVAPPVGGEEPRAVDFSALDVVAKQELLEKNVPGAVVVVVQGDRVVYAKGFGVASAESTDPVTPDHLFRVGSTTKLFVGATVAKLAEAGRLKLNEPIGKLVDGLTPQIAALTPHQLLTHTAGLADGNMMFGRHDDDALGAGIKKWKDDRFFTAPGDIYSYSNPGYWLAGYAAEKASGKPFADAVADELFKPLGMKRTTFRPTLAMTYPLAQGHELRGGKPSVVRPAADNAATWPAGSMFTSGNDFARFVIAFLNGGKLDGEQALTDSLVKTIAGAHVPLATGRGHYGYGLMTRTHRGVKLVGHDGARVGYASTLLMAPEHKFGVVVLMNRSGAALTKTAEKAIELVVPLGPVTKSKDESKPSADELAKLAGTYRNGAQSVTLDWEDGKLTEAAGKGAVVEPLGGSRFRGAAPFEIVTGKDGKATYLVRGARAFKKDTKK